MSIRTNGGRLGSFGGVRTARNMVLGSGMGALPTLVEPMDLGGFGGPFVVAGTAGTGRLILGFQSATDVDV